jgi:hypothetical protein
MSDTDKTLRIKIETEATGQQGAAQVESMLTKAKEQAVAGNLLVKKTTEDAMGATAEHNKHLEGARKIISEINRIAPGMGEVLHSLFLGAAGPALAFAAAVLEIKKGLEEYNKVLDAAAQSAAMPTFLEGILAAKAAMADGREKIDDYAESIERVAKAEQSIAQALAQQLELMHAVAAAREAAAKAQQAAIEAETRRRQASGELSPERAVIAETQQAIAAAKAESVAKRDVVDHEIADKQAALDKSTTAQGGLDAAAKSTAGAYFAEKAKRDKLTADFSGPEDKKAMEDAQKERDKIQADLDNNTSYTRAKKLRKEAADAKPGVHRDELLRSAKEYESDFDAPNILGGPSVAEMIARMGQIDAGISARRAGEAQYNATQAPESQEAFERSKTDYEEADKKGRANAEEIKALKEQLATATANRSATGSLEDRALEDRISAILSGAVEKLYKEHAGGELESGVSIADAVEKNKSVSDSQAQFLMALDQALGGHATTLRQAASNVERFKDDTGAFFNAVIGLTSKGFEAQQKQLDMLYNQVGMISGFGGQ